MRYSFVVIAALAVSASAQSKIPRTPLPGDVDPTRVPAIEELFVLTDLEQMQREALPRLQASFFLQFERQILDPRLKSIDRSKLAADLQDFETRVWSLVVDRVDFGKGKAEFVKMYADTFTPDEIDGIVAFYKSPPGRALLEKQSALAMKGLARAQEKIRDAMPDIQKMTEPWIEDMKKRYGPPQ